MIDVVALGELLIDFAAKSADAGGYPTMAANPGGAPGNFLAALGVYGCKTAFIGKVGADTFGRLLRRTMQHAGIETKGIVEDPEVFTTLAFVTFDASGDRSFSFARKPGADTQLRWDEVNLHLIDEARVFHFGTLSLTDEQHHTAGSRLREGEGQAHHLRPQPARAALENPGCGKGADALESYTVRRRQNQRQRGCVSLGLFARRRRAAAIGGI